jgi:uncharacterized membrane protein
MQKQGKLPEGAAGINKRIITMQIKSRHILYAIVILTLLLILIIAVFPGNVLRIILGLPLALFFPGYCLMSALFPRQSAIDRLEKIALSFGISLAIVPLIGFALNYTPFGIRLYPILISLAVFIVVVSAIAWFRQRSLPEEEKPAITIQFKKSLTGGFSRTDRILTVVLIIAILGAIGTLAYVIAVPRIGEQFTEFYILGKGGKAADYPTQLKLGEAGNVIVGVINHEQKSGSYTLEVRIDGAASAPQPLTLANEEKWERPLTFTPEKAGDKQKVEFLLYKTGQNEPYEELHLWVDVKP